MLRYGRDARLCRAACGTGSRRRAGGTGTPAAVAGWWAIGRLEGQPHGGLLLPATAGYRDRSVRRPIRGSTVLELRMLDLEEIATARRTRTAGTTAG